MPQGRVLTWGKGLLGHGDRTDQDHPTLLNFSRFLPVDKVACGAEHVVVLSDIGEVYTFGTSAGGKLGHGPSVADELEPRLIEALESTVIFDIAAGANFTVAVSRDHQVYVWGRGSHGELGEGLEGETSVPVHLTALDDRDVMAVACGDAHALAMTEDGRVYQWGRQQSATDIAYPQPVPLQHPAVCVMAAANYNMVVTEDGSLFTWGEGIDCQLGLGAQVFVKGTPTRVSGLGDERLVRISTGSKHVLVLTHTGKVFGWGSCRYQQLARADEDDVPLPFLLPTDGLTQESHIVDVIAAGSRSYIMLDNGKAFVCGAGSPTFTAAFDGICQPGEHILQVCNASATNVLLVGARDPTALPVRAPTKPEDVVVIPPTPSQLSAKMKRIGRLDESDIPASYYTDTAHEELAMEYAQEFKEQFTALYPERELVLTPPNECGVNKLICTYLRPTKGAFPELITLEGAASFVADFVTFEQLPDPLLWPEALVSPATLLQWRAGDAFDMSLLLCSLLLGCGYDAYCVSGCARIHITTCDRTRENAPAPPAPAVVVPPPSEPNKYLAMLTKRNVLESEFDKRIERERQALLHPASPATPKKPIRKGRRDPLAGRRRHCWVLVKQDSRVPHDVFVEPTTGNIVPVATSSGSYTSVDYLWNAVNYFINMRTEVPPHALSYDLFETANWEFVFVPRNLRPVHSGLMLGSVDSDPSAAQETVSSAVTGGDEVLEVPVTWVDRIHILPQMVTERWPSKMSAIDFATEHVEKYAPGMHLSGLMSLTKRYADSARQQLVETVEVYQHRLDKLQKRVRQHRPESIVTEYYETGRPAGLIQIMTEGQSKRVLLFEARSRLDGLTQREDMNVPMKPPKSREYYVNRDDFLVLRTVSFARPIIRKVKGPFDFDGHTPLKIVLTYARNPAAKSGTEDQIYKIKFAIADDKILQQFHTGAHYVTAASKMFVKASRAQITQVDPYVNMPSPKQIKNDCFTLADRQKAEMSDVESSIRHINTVLAQLLEQQEIENQINSKSDMEETVTEDDTVTRLPKNDDYLRHFLADVANPDKFTRAEAVRVRDRLLDDLRTRLVARSHIIQTRLVQETEELHRRQAVYQRDRERLDHHEEEEYIRFCNQAMFRIEVLEKRLREHTNNALRRYASMSEQIRADRRFEALFVVETPVIPVPAPGRTSTTRDGRLATGRQSSTYRSGARNSITALPTSASQLHLGSARSGMPSQQQTSLPSVRSRVSHAQ
eukprot:TRINITY_DN9839_c0_g1_i1.p1 TRINITY_DN9839_c0_g1~~TRINITY_DN9839_c0_g1_i1.p1  ORF type:complete len:1237 (+),score=282.14 TRINITY_DN9839_c0_g1_i1:1605-5315(+)